MDYRFASLAIAVILFVTACSAPVSPPSPQLSPPQVAQTPAPSSQPPTGQPATAPEVTATPPPPQAPIPRLTDAQVIRVIDGDTIEVSIEGRSYTVRYIGIDTPETVHPSKPVQPFGPEASAMNKYLVDGKKVRLEKDVSETDKYGRLLRYVYVGDTMINAELLILGYAQVTTYPPDVKYVDLFLQLQREAREAGRGLWAQPIGTPPVMTIPSETSPPPMPEPAPISASLTLTIVSVTSPVSAGASATLAAQTLPGAQCSITVYYKSGPSSASGLYPKTADSTGRVSWTWKVGTRTTPGSWRIVVKATSGGQTISQETYFTVR